MESPKVVADVFGRVRDILHGALKDLTPQELVAGPKPRIGWLSWHLSRVQDSNISGLAGREQAWIADRWHARFGMAPDPRDYASGHSQTPAQGRDRGRRSESSVMTKKTLVPIPF
jgi:hypothetical protein